MLFDTEGVPCDCEYIKVNEAYENQTSLSSNLLVGKTIRGIYPEGQADDVIRMYADVFQSGVPIQKELFFEPLNRWFQISVYTIANDEFAVVVQNVTEYKQTQQALEKNHAYLHSILETMHDGFWAIEPDQCFTDVNAAYCAMSGYTRDEFLKLHIQDIDAEEKPEETDAHMRKILETGHDVFETRHRRKNGSTFLVEVSVIYLTYPEKRLICFCRDITARKLVEDRVRTLLDEKQLLLKETHHRIKNDMNMIYSLLYLQANNQSNAEANSVLLNAASRTQSMLMLYEKLYCSSDYNSLGVKSFLTQLIEEINNVLPSVATVRFEVLIDDFILNARTLSRLGIIINELITNSVKYAFRGRTDGLIRLAVSVDGATATLDYADDGPGLPAETGFGLSSGFGMQLISMMVDEIAGTVELVRTSGARFLIRWPV